MKVRKSVRNRRFLNLFDVPLVVGEGPVTPVFGRGISLTCGGIH